MPDKFTVVKYAFEGEKFEILVKPDPALDYKLGKIKDISSILVSDEVYENSSKGTRVSSEKLQKIFKTNDTLIIAEKILQKGDLNLTTEQRRKMTTEKRKQIITFIAKTFVDPRSHLPHPPQRIEQAITDAHVNIDPFKSVEEQIKDIVENLRSIIPLKSENLLLEISVPAQYVAKSYSVLKSTGTLKKEDWQTDGSLKAILEIPAAVRPSVIDKLGAVTKGTAFVEVLK
jgi:ribosome maturation protein SDO1